MSSTIQVALRACGSYAPFMTSIQAILLYTVPLSDTLTRAGIRCLCQTRRLTVQELMHGWRAHALNDTVPTVPHRDAKWFCGAEDGRLCLRIVHDTVKNDDRRVLRISFE